MAEHTKLFISNLTKKQQPPFLLLFFFTLDQFEKENKTNTASLKKLESLLHLATPPNWIP
jgi:hypothetical protein